MSMTRQKVIANSFVRSHFEKKGISIRHFAETLKENRTTLDRFLYTQYNDSLRLHVKCSQYFDVELNDWYQGYVEGIDTKGGITISLNEGNVGAPH